MNPLDFSLTDLNSQPYNLGSLLQEGKLNLLLFYNTDCLGCTGRAIPLAFDLAQRHAFINLIVIHSNFGFKKQSVADIKSIFSSGESPFPIYCEENHELYSHFDCDGTPHWIILKVNGTVTHSIFGSQDGAQLKLEYAIEEYENL